MTCGSGLRKFQADGFLLDRVYYIFLKFDDDISAKCLKQKCEVMFDGFCSDSSVSGNNYRLHQFIEVLEIP